MIELAYVRLRDQHPAHDPAMGARPTMESQRAEFTTQHHRLSLDENSGVIAVKSREVPGVTVYVHIGACRFALGVEP